MQTSFLCKADYIAYQMKLTTVAPRIEIEKAVDIVACVVEKVVSVEEDGELKCDVEVSESSLITPSGKLVTIIKRVCDGLVNASRICKDYNKVMQNFTRWTVMMKFKASLDLSYPGVVHIGFVTKGANEHRGTYVCADLLFKLASWLDADLEAILIRNMIVAQGDANLKVSTQQLQNAMIKETAKVDALSAVYLGIINKRNDVTIANLSAQILSNASLVLESNKTLESLKLKNIKIVDLEKEVKELQQTVVDQHADNVVYRAQLDQSSLRDRYDMELSNVNKKYQLLRHKELFFTTQNLEYEHQIDVLNAELDRLRTSLRERESLLDEYEEDDDAYECIKDATIRIHATIQNHKKLLAELPQSTRKRLKDGEDEQEQNINKKQKV